LIGTLMGRLRGAHANHKRIAAGALWIAVLVAAAKLFVAAREMALAWRYGVSATVDAYQFAFTIITWLPLILAALASAVLVPRLVALHRDPAAYRRFTAELNGTALAVGLAVALLSWFLAPRIVGLVATDFDPDALRLARSMATQLSPVAFLVTAAGYLAARLQARERYAYSFAEAVPALAIALFVILAPGRDGGAVLIWGTLVGYVAQALWLADLTRRSDPPLLQLGLRHRAPEWKLVYMPLLVMAAGQVVLTVTNPVDVAFAAQLGEGAVATLGYANRIVGLIVGFSLVVVGRALLPVLSGAVADGEHALGTRQSLQWAMLLFGIGAAAVIAGWPLAPTAVALIFERGAFDSADSAVVTHVLRYGLLQLPFVFGGLVLVQWIAASGRYGVLLAVACLALVVKITMNLLLLQPLGLAGLMAATAGMYAVSFLGQLAFVMRKR
jgi:murein biosynthesis integral membrane protein MurJ